MVNEVKIYKKNALFHKINAYASAILNYMIIFIGFMFIETAYSKTIPIIAFFLIAAISISFKIDYEMTVNDIGVASLVFKYMCSFALSGLGLYKLFENGIINLALIVVFTMAIELCMIPVINHRYRIRNAFIRLFKKRK